MSATEVEEFVLGVLTEKGRLTTGEIENHARDLGKTCPDKTILILTKLKARGIIQGDFDMERRTWVWWV